jgi:hypothetical protein
MANKISRVTKDAKLDKRTSMGRAAAGKNTSNKNAEKKILRGK